MAILPVFDIRDWSSSHGRRPTSGWIGKQVTEKPRARDVPLGGFILTRDNKDGKNDNYHLLSKEVPAAAPLAMLDPVQGAIHSKFLGVQVADYQMQLSF